MTNIKRGQIYYISKSPYRPTCGSVQEPNRPAIIVSNDDNNTYSYTVEIVYLTTAPKKDLPTHCTIRSSNQPSIALCEQVTTVSTEQIGDLMGTCTAEEMRSVDACIAISLGLDLYQTEEEYEEEYEETIEEATDGDTEGMAEELNWLREECTHLNAELIRAEKSAEIYKELYNDLLSKILNK